MKAEFNEEIKNLRRKIEVLEILRDKYFKDFSREASVLYGVCDTILKQLEEELDDLNETWATKIIMEELNEKI